MSRAAHKPTETTRAEVQALSGFGVREDEIAAYVGISAPTLRRHYRTELDTGHVRANVAVARSLFKQATEGNVAAAIFWMKARAGWREKHEVDINHPGGKLAPEEPITIHIMGVSPESRRVESLPS